MSQRVRVVVVVAVAGGVEKERRRRSASQLALSTRWMLWLRNERPRLKTLSAMLSIANKACWLVAVSVVVPLAYCRCDSSHFIDHASGQMYRL